MKQATLIVKTEVHETGDQNIADKGDQESNAAEEINMQQTIVENLLRSATLHLGRITQIDKETQQIRVVCPSISEDEQIATLGSPYLSSQALLYATDRFSFVVLDFQTYDGQPIIRDVLYSMNDKVKSNKKDLNHKNIHILADEITLEGKQKVTIKSGDSETVYEAKKGKLTTIARKIRSAATMENKVQGGSVRIN